MLKVMAALVLLLIVITVPVEINQLLRADSANAVVSEPMASPEEEVVELSSVTEIRVLADGVEVFSRVEPLYDYLQTTSPPLGSYILASTDSSSMLVPTGYSNWVATALNVLLDEDLERLPGGEVWLKTELSGEKWLVYDITDVLIASKRDSVTDIYIWGEPDATAGILILDCYPDAISDSTEDNFMVIARFKKIVSE